MSQHDRGVRRRRSKTSRHRRQRRQWWRRVAIFALAGIAMLTLVVFASVKGRELYRSWRESKSLKRANALLARGELPAAESAAHQALTLNTESVPAFRLLAEITERENRAETVAWRAQVARREPQNLDNQLNLASAALRFGKLEIARDALGRAAPDDRDRASYHIVAGWLARAQGNTSEEERHFAAAVEKEPASDLYQFNFAVLEIQSPDPEKNARARDQLERLAKVPEFRTPSLRALLDNALRQNQLQAAEGFAQDLQMSPQVGFGDYLTCLRLYRKLDPKKFEALLEKMKPVAARNPVDLTQLFDWMNRNGLSSELLKWTEKLPPELVTNPPPAVSVAEALASTKNWSRLKRWTRSGSWGEVEYFRLAYQAFAAVQLKQTAAEAEFTALWNDAERAAAGEPERELNLARLATRLKLSTQAEQLWLRVGRNAANGREALDALYQIYRAANDLPHLYETALRLHETSPDEADLSADAAHFALLLDHNTAEGRRLAKEAYEKTPENAMCAVTYAFALYGAGRSAEGLQVLKKLPADELRNPRNAAYYAVLLADENQTAAAAEFAAIARAGAIFPEEKRMLDEGLSKLSQATPAPSTTPVSLPAASTPTPAP
jgi:hypothetical protein